MNYFCFHLLSSHFCLQCFDAVGWAAGRASGLLLMTLPLTVSGFSKIQIGFIFLVLANPSSTGQRAVKRVCVCVCVRVCLCCQRYWNSIFVNFLNLWWPLTSTLTGSTRSRRKHVTLFMSLTSLLQGRIDILAVVLLGCVASRPVIGWRLPHNNSTQITHGCGFGHDSCCVSDACSPLYISVRPAVNVVDSSNC